MTAFWEQAQLYVWNIFNRPQLNDIIDILIVATVIYYAIVLLRQTRASELIKGLILVIGMALLSNLLGLTAFTWLLNLVLQNGALVLIILFQPELRRMLEQLGRRNWLHHTNENDAYSHIISEIAGCLTRLARRRVGALIVFEQNTGLKDIIETGTLLDSDISGALLENIFEPNTPLHDGAVVIRGSRVMAAACVLPLSESSSITKDLGTRHRAGIGVTESTDSIVLIVSEETGIISMAKDGKLTRRLDESAVRQVLGGLYQREASPIHSWFSSLLRRRRGQHGQ